MPRGAALHLVSARQLHRPRGATPCGVSSSDTAPCNAALCGAAPCDVSPWDSARVVPCDSTSAWRLLKSIRTTCDADSAITRPCRSHMPQPSTHAAAPRQLRGSPAITQASRSPAARRASISPHSCRATADTTTSRPEHSCRSPRSSNHTSGQPGTCLSVRTVWCRPSVHRAHRRAPHWHTHASSREEKLAEHSEQSTGAG